MNKQTQKHRVLARLRRGSLTTRQATRELDVYRLSERIRELSWDGHHIEIDYPVQDGKRWARYWLVQEARVAA